MVKRAPPVRMRTIQCLKGYAELQYYAADYEEHVCFSMHGPRGGFAGNFWFPSQDLVDMLAELGFTAGAAPTDRSLSLEIVMEEIGRVERLAEAESHHEWLLVLIQQLGTVAKVIMKGNLVSTIAELSKVAAIAIAMMQLGEEEEE